MVQTMKIDREKAVNDLREAWDRYVEAFGVPPHGTKRQLAALLELATPEAWIVEGE